MKPKYLLVPALASVPTLLIWSCGGDVVVEAPAVEAPEDDVDRAAPEATPDRSEGTPDPDLSAVGHLGPSAEPADRSADASCVQTACEAFCGELGYSGICEENRCRCSFSQHSSASGWDAGLPSSTSELVASPTTEQTAAPAPAASTPPTTTPPATQPPGALPPSDTSREVHAAIEANQQRAQEMLADAGIAPPDGGLPPSRLP